jgi:hypothetical protein
MIPAPLLHGPEHESAHILRPECLQVELFGLGSSRQKLPHHWQAVAYGGLAEIALLSQVAGITSHQSFNGLAQRRIGRLGDEMSLTEGVEQELAGSPLAMMRAKVFPPVLSEGVDLLLV